MWNRKSSWHRYLDCEQIFWTRFEKSLSYIQFFFFSPFHQISKVYFHLKLFDGLSKNVISFLSFLFSYKFEYFYLLNFFFFLSNNFSDTNIYFFFFYFSFYYLFILLFFREFFIWWQIFDSYFYEQKSKNLFIYQFI